jgi:hypothetical protein
MEYYSVTGPEDRGTELLEPDIVTPDQFAGLLKRRSWQDGERRLMAAVLLDGVETFHTHAFSESPEGQELFEESKRWVMDDQDHSLFAFETVCAVLEIEPAYLRGGLLAWVEQNRRSRTRIHARHLEDPRRRVRRRFAVNQ